MKFRNRNDAERNITQMSVNNTHEKKKIPTGWNRLLGKPHGVAGLQMFIWPSTLLL